MDALDESRGAVPDPDDGDPDRSGLGGGFVHESSFAD
jgi:hypothetical protein